MMKLLAATAILLGTAATAQVVTSYKTNNPAPVKGEPDRIVCQKHEKIGTRLGAEKVCLTVREWRERELAGRDETERTQLNTRVCGEGSCPIDPF